jgi:VIT1/CCC1 family predicted Fe2+/Mn2+ transporter
MKVATISYLVLVLLTLTTYIIGESGHSGYVISMAVLFIAMIKGALVGDYFMQLKGITGLWRWPVMIWLMIPGGLIAIAFYLVEQEQIL